MIQVNSYSLFTAVNLWEKMANTLWGACGNFEICGVDIMREQIF